MRADYEGEGEKHGDGRNETRMDKSIRIIN
jgi:hypothetical protein